MTNPYEPPNDGKSGRKRLLTRKRLPGAFPRALIGRFGCLSPLGILIFICLPAAALIAAFLVSLLIGYVIG
jgi:hypothetical protein